MSTVVLRIAQIVGVVVLAGIAISIVAGLLQWALVAAVIVAVPLGGWWLYTRLSGRRTTKPGAVRPVAGSPTDRRRELEGRAVIDTAGRCGWCGSTVLHKDDFGFPTTPLAHHRAEIDAML